MKNDGSAEAEISWQLEYPAIIKYFSSEYGCACMQPDAHSHTVKVELSYEGKYYAAAPDTDYRLNGITAMNMPINVVQYRRSKAHAADSNPCFYSRLVKHQILNDFLFSGCLLMITKAA